jgi:hypothetical protein
MFMKVATFSGSAYTPPLVQPQGTAPATSNSGTSGAPKFGCAISAGCCASALGVLGLLSFLLIKNIKKLCGAFGKPSSQPSGRPM